MRIANLILVIILSLIAPLSQSRDNMTRLTFTNGLDYPVAPEFFGLHFHNLQVRPQDVGKFKPTIWPDIPFKSIRLWDATVTWQQLSPSAGVWDFSRLDYYVNQSMLHQANILYTLGNTPKWVSSRPNEICSYGTGCGAEPVKLAHWQEYVKRVATRYKGKINAFELWNEPKFSDIENDKVFISRGGRTFFTGSAATMVELARTARQALDEVDPSIILTSPGFTNGPHRLEAFLAEGGGQYVQAISYHFYSRDAVHMQQQVHEVRAVMQKYGVQDLPLWNTETGVEVHPHDKPLPLGANPEETEETAAARMSQYLILAAGSGLSRYFYYAWDNNLSGLLNPTTGTIKAARYEALKSTLYYLENMHFHGCQTIDSVRKAMLCSASKDDMRYLFVWSDRSYSYPLHIPEGWNIQSVDPIVGNTYELPTLASKGGKLALQLHPLVIRLRPN